MTVPTHGAPSGGK